MNDREVELEELVRRARFCYDDLIDELCDAIEALMGELEEIRRQK